VPRTDRFNGWVPAVAVAAVCFAMVLVASPPQLLRPQDAAAVPVAAEDDWTINNSPQAHAAPVSSPRPNRVPIVSRPVDLRQQQFPVLRDKDLREIKRQMSATQREIWAREMESLSPILMQSLGRSPRFQDEANPFSAPRQRAPLRNDE
jgi:hypothetical protein